MRLSGGECEGNGPPAPVCDHTGFCTVAAARAAKCLTPISLWLSPPFLCARRLVVRPDVGAVEKGHAERDVVLLDEVEQPFPDALLRPAE